MRKTWRCFFCDAVFTRRIDAAEHFGASEMATPACQIKGHEHGLVGVIRKQEEELQRYRAEDSDLIRVVETLKSEHAAELRTAEETGFARGVEDMKRHGIRVP